MVAAFGPTTVSVPPLALSITAVTTGRPPSKNVLFPCLAWRSSVSTVEEKASPPKKFRARVLDPTVLVML